MSSHVRGPDGPRGDARPELRDYSGFEHCEKVAVREGPQDYRHSEKSRTTQRVVRMRGAVFGNTVITVVTIDLHQTQKGPAVVPAQFGLPPSFTVRGVLSD